MPPRANSSTERPARIQLRDRCSGTHAATARRAQQSSTARYSSTPVGATTVAWLLCVLRRSWRRRSASRRARQSDQDRPLGPRFA